MDVDITSSLHTRQSLVSFAESYSAVGFIHFWSICGLICFNKPNHRLFDKFKRMWLMLLLCFSCCIILVVVVVLFLCLICSVVSNSSWLEICARLCSCSRIVCWILLILFHILEFCVVLLLWLFVLCLK